MSSTHVIELGPDIVVKRYRSWSRDEPRREWRALRLLADHAPGLAPVAVDAALTGDAPYVAMSRLRGEPLGTGAVSDDQVDAAAAAIRVLHAAIPDDVLAALPLRVWHVADTVDMVGGWCAERPTLGADPLVAEAFRLGEAWLSAQEVDGWAAVDVAPVFGQADGNLANFLWDGSRVQLVDFEDSGRSDRAFELADAVEHVSMRVAGVDAGRLLAGCNLTAAETIRLAQCRRLFAVFWLLMLLPGGPAHKRNPPETLQQQAEHLLALLG